MINRYYLPYKSARDYQDRKMAKWMGFFLSEHTQRLNEEIDMRPESTLLNMATKHTLLHQAYLQKLVIIINCYFQKKTSLYIGTVTELALTFILLKTKQNQYHRVYIEEIVDIQLKGDNDEIT